MTDESQPGQRQKSNQPNWGDNFSTIRLDRQRELRRLAEKQQVWAAQAEGARTLEQSAFYGVELNGAEVFFLAALASAGPEGDLEETADKLRAATSVNSVFDIISLSALHLEGAALGGVYMQDAYFSEAWLRGVNFTGCRLQGADFSGAHLQEAIFDAAWLQDVVFTAAELQGASFSFSSPKGAFFNGANLEGARFSQARLQGTDFGGSVLQEVSFIGAVFDRKTKFAGAHLLTPEDNRPLLARSLLRPRYGPSFRDIEWGDFDPVQLTQLQGWDDIRRLADERGLTWRDPAAWHRDAVRAYRQVTQRFRDQGYSDIADRMADRAQIWQRKLLFRQMLEDWNWRSPSRLFRLPGDLLRWLFSWFLALLAGYGYHPGRSVFWYLATIAGFTIMYMQATHGWVPFGLPTPSQLAPLPWYEALILSVSSFHGRGFFQPLESLGDPIAALAAIEAVIGLLIEISFIATFTQRFFGSR